MEESSLLKVDKSNIQNSEGEDCENSKPSNIKGYPLMDEIINKSGYNRYIITLIFSCSIFFFSEGVQLYAFNLLMPIMKKLPEATHFSYSLLSNSALIGYSIGSFLVGPLTKNFGRKVPILIFSTILSVFSLIIISFESMYWFILCRVIIGCCIGVIGSQYISNLTEYLPITNREIVISCVLCNYVVGILYYILCFKLIMPNFEPNRWRIILIFGSIPCIISGILAYYYVKDSPRLSFNRNNFEEGLKELKNLSSSSNIVLTSEEISELKQQQRQSNRNTTVQFSFKMLISKEFIQLTIVNQLLLLTTSMIYMSNMYSLPLILYKGHEKNIFTDIILAQSVSIPAMIIASVIAGLPHFGIKHTITIGFAVSLLFSLIACGFESLLIVSSAVINFFIMISFVLSKLYLIESYPSKLRDHGMSVIYVITRAGESFTPILCEYLFRKYDFGPFALISSLIFVGIAAASFIPFETRGESLDSKF